jgi:two-component system response regulator DctR
MTMRNKVRIEIVDDDAALRDSLTVLLQVFGYSVRSWPSAETFLENFDAAGCDCLLIDLRMPRIGGLELISRLRAHASTPIILMSGHGDAEIWDRATALGITEFLEKPFSIDRLKAAIEAAIAGRA